jgi:hypothetical protein
LHTADAKACRHRAAALQPVKTTVSSYQMEGRRKVFFFEKKKQKTFEFGRLRVVSFMGTNAGPA